MSSEEAQGSQPNAETTTPAKTTGSTQATPPPTYGRSPVMMGPLTTENGEESENSDDGGAEKSTEGEGETIFPNVDDTKAMMAYLVTNQQLEQKAQKKQQSAVDKKQVNKDQETMVKASRLTSTDPVRCLMWLEEQQACGNLWRALKDVINQNHWLKPYLPVADLRADGMAMKEGKLLLLVFNSIVSLAKARGANERQDENGMVAFWFIEQVGELDTNAEVFGKNCRNLADLEDTIKKVITAVDWLFESLIEGLSGGKPTRTMYNEVYLKLCVSKHLITEKVRLRMFTRTRNMLFSEVTEQMRGEVKLCRERRQQGVPANSFGAGRQPENQRELFQPANSFGAGRQPENQRELFQPDKSNRDCHFGSRCKNPRCNRFHNDDQDLSRQTKRRILGDDTPRFPQRDSPEHRREKSPRDANKGPRRDRSPDRGDRTPRKDNTTRAKPLNRR